MAHPTCLSAISAVSAVSARAFRSPPGAFALERAESRGARVRAAIAAGTADYFRESGSCVPAFLQM